MSRGSGSSSSLISPKSRRLSLAPPNMAGSLCGAVLVDVLSMGDWMASRESSTIASRGEKARRVRLSKWLAIRLPALEPPALGASRQAGIESAEGKGCCYGKPSKVGMICTEGVD
jgi:hypothetical protein